MNKLNHPSRDKDPEKEKRDKIPRSAYSGVHHIGRMIGICQLVHMHDRISTACASK